MEIASGIEPVHDGRIFIELINWPMLGHGKDATIQSRLGEVCSRRDQPDGFPRHQKPSAPPVAAREKVAIFFGTAKTIRHCLHAIARRWRPECLERVPRRGLRPDLYARPVMRLIVTISLLTAIVLAEGIWISVLGLGLLRLLPT
jgi:hypothetical protein